MIYSHSRKMCSPESKHQSPSWSCNHYPVNSLLHNLGGKGIAQQLWPPETFNQWNTPLTRNKQWSLHFTEALFNFLKNSKLKNNLLKIDQISRWPRMSQDWHPPEISSTAPVKLQISIFRHGNCLNQIIYGGLESPPTPTCSMQSEAILRSFCMEINSTFLISVCTATN